MKHFVLTAFYFDCWFKGALGDGRVSALITSPSTPYYNRVYEYDALNRLTTATVEDAWGGIDYSYDDVGNRLTEITDDASNAYAYTTGTDLLTSVTDAVTTNYTYDANGNITGIGTKTLTYNQDNRLISVVSGSTTLGTYTYNGLGQRVKKVAGSTTTIFLYDFDGNIIGESNVSGTFSKEYLYRGSSRLAMVDVSKSKVYYFGNDQLGTPEILTDSTNTVVWEAIYKPFGEAEVNEHSTVVNNFRFPGQYYDAETGLHYNYQRYYDPSTGRYLSADPIGFNGGINLFGYVENNPVNSVDLFGLISDCCDKNDPTNKKVLDFMATNLPDARILADRLNVPVENVLGLASEESGQGTSNIAKVAHNFFGIHAGVAGSTGTYTTSGGAKVSVFPEATGFSKSGEAFIQSWGSLVSGKVDPESFASALVPSFNTGKAENGGNPNFIPLVKGAIKGIKKRLLCFE